MWINSHNFLGPLGRNDALTVNKTYTQNFGRLPLELKLSQPSINLTRLSNCGCTIALPEENTGTLRMPWI